MSGRHLGIFFRQCVLFFFSGKMSERYVKMSERHVKVSERQFGIFFQARCLRAMLRCLGNMLRWLRDILAFFQAKCLRDMLKCLGDMLRCMRDIFLIFWRFNISVNLVNVSLKKSSFLLLFLQTLKAFLTQFPTQFISTCHSRNLYLWRCLEITFQKHKTFFDKMFHQGIHLSLSQFSSCRSEMFSFDSWAVLLTPSTCAC